MSFDTDDTLGKAGKVKRASNSQNNKKAKRTDKITGKESVLGRPRSEESQNSIYKTTYKLLQKMSIRDVTIDLISKRAKVSKATIYRWWPSKIALIIDAYLVSLAPRTHYQEYDSARDAIREQVARQIEAYKGVDGRIVAQIIAECQWNRDSLKEFHHRFLDHRRKETRAVIEKGKAQGEFSKDVSTKIIIDMIYGPIYFRLLVADSLDMELEYDFLDILFKAIEPKH